MNPNNPHIQEEDAIDVMALFLQFYLTDGLLLHP